MPQTMQEEQGWLWGRARPRLATVALNDIAPWRTVGAKSRTRRSIQQLGFASAVLLRELPATPAAGIPSYRYQVIDGAGRLGDARAQGLEVVPALILPASVTELEAAAHRTSSNLNRRANPMQEAEALGTLVRGCREHGLPEAEAPKAIAGMLGLALSVVRQRLRLLSLPGELQEGVKEGKIAAGVAARIANLSPGQQQALARLCRKAGRVTGKDVQRLRLARRQAELASLPDALFEPPVQGAGPAASLRKLVGEMRRQGFDREELLELVARACSEAPMRRTP